uniref:Uncharacterized protein n=1 Tax=Chromera velia CCMP2878 TaxID=1169474 RepID=A0A0G4HX32_9ALVE|eukprot:Cvel_9175.t1-p1 / transcript=Cvel_9175.t1 / gene=Cvel_9175 / organism=Chromera_velia_CCMP2878 / gene_product=hypothetical protein / transcript_product=hypothetical protein / location=Cvel_scaffold522:68065-70394(+) / protein_length=649 / sequence_SO=supercontig / SO=protein_coding / is_pseudo=false
MEASKPRKETQPNPPLWPSSVQVFTPDVPLEEIRAKVNNAYLINGGDGDHGQFSSHRFAFLFAPGTYDVDVPVGYYTQVMGLGVTPDDVIFTGPKGVHSEESNYWFQVGALNTFWRSAENFKTKPGYNWFPGAVGMLWAVSQGAPLRRVHVDSDLLLFQYTFGDAAGFASGGFMADSKVEGTVKSGSQQQWLTRNCAVLGWEGAVWNMMFVGTTGAPASHCGKDGGVPIVTVESSPMIAEKPFLSVDKEGNFSLLVPPVKLRAAGPTDWTAADSDLRKIDFSEVYVAKNKTDSAASINRQLAAGLHVVLTPGIYMLESPLTVQHEGQVLLGLGFPTLTPSSSSRSPEGDGGTSAVKVASGVTGARVAGILVEAGRGKGRKDILVEVGGDGKALDTSEGSLRGSRDTSVDRSAAGEDPVVLSDVFVRVGSGGVGDEGDEVSADLMMKVESSGVILDNVWLWRADHGAGGASVRKGKNVVRGGLDVGGDDVTVYGLFVEHAMEDQVLWRGERGKTFMMESELPYDVDQESFGQQGFVGYRVAPDVQTHNAWGVGVYHFFKSPVEVEFGIVCPSSVEENFVSPLSVWLNGNGRMQHIINESGEPTFGREGQAQYVCSASPSTNRNSQKEKLSGKEGGDVNVLDDGTETVFLS